MELTQEQKNGIKCEMGKLLRPIFPDASDRMEAISYLAVPVYTDIEDCADWSDLAEDEVHTGDIQIALRRVLMSAIEDTYYGEVEEEED